MPDEIEAINKLKYAILKDAIMCLKKECPDNWYGTCKTSLEVIKEREARIAEYWIKKVDHEYEFSFDNVCYSLGLEPDYLRRKLC